MFHLLHRLLRIGAWLTVLALAAAVWWHADILRRLAERHAVVRRVVPTDATRGPELHGLVTKVRTADTLEFRDTNRVTYLLRLAGLEGPRSIDLAREARAAINPLVQTQSVRVATFHLTPERVAVGVVWSEGTNLNELLLARGLARTTTNALRLVPLTDQPGLLRAEQRAREGGLGMWR